MPLSEEELRLLEQMERALVQEDPRLAHTLRGTAHRIAARRRAMISVAVFVLGVVMLMAGAMSGTTPLGIAGFVVMLGAASVGMTAWRVHVGADDESDPRPAAGPTPGEAPTFLERFVRRMRRDDPEA